MAHTFEYHSPYGEFPEPGKQNVPQFTSEARSIFGVRRAHQRAMPAYEALLRRQQGLEQLLRSENPFIGGITSPLQGALTYAQTLRGGLDQLPGLLQQSALAGTQGAQVAAVQAARQAGAGRGGLAFGGGAGAIAARAARGAATDQSAALAQALAQAEQAKAGYNLQQAGLETGIQGTLAQAIAGQAQLFEGRLGAQANAMAGLQQMLLELAMGAPGREKGDRFASLGSFGSAFSSIGSGLKDIAAANRPPI